MFYIKAKLTENVEVKVPMYDNRIYTQCPDCGTEHAVEIADIARIIHEGGDFVNTSVYCEKCSKKEKTAASHSADFMEKE